MLNNKLFVGVAVATIGFGSLLANADSSVIGQLNTSTGTVISSGASQHVIDQQQTPYIQGDVVSTGDSASASIVFVKGSGALTIAKNSSAAVVSEAPAEILLTNGGVKVQLNDADSVTFNTPAGKFVVTSDSAINAVAAFNEGEFALISQAGVVAVETENGDVVTNVEADNAFSFTANEGARALDVQLVGGGGCSNTCKILIGLGVVGAIILIADDDDDPASP